MMRAAATDDERSLRQGELLQLNLVQTLVKN